MSDSENSSSSGGGVPLPPPTTPTLSPEASDLDSVSTLELEPPLSPTPISPLTIVPLSPSPPTPARAVVRFAQSPPISQGRRGGISAETLADFQAQQDAMGYRGYGEAEFKRDHPRTKDSDTPGDKYFGDYDITRATRGAGFYSPELLDNNSNSLNMNNNQQQRGLGDQVPGGNFGGYNLNQQGDARGYNSQELPNKVSGRNNVTNIGQGRLSGPSVDGGQYDPRRDILPYSLYGYGNKGPVNKDIANDSRNGSRSASNASSAQASSSYGTTPSSGVSTNIGSLSLSKVNNEFYRQTGLAPHKIANLTDDQSELYLKILNEELAKVQSPVPSSSTLSRDYDFRLKDFDPRPASPTYSQRYGRGDIAGPSGHYGKTAIADEPAYHRGLQIHSPVPQRPRPHFESQPPNVKRQFYAGQSVYSFIGPPPQDVRHLYQDNEANLFGGIQSPEQYRALLEQRARIEGELANLRAAQELAMSGGGPSSNAADRGGDTTPRPFDNPLNQSLTEDPSLSGSLSTSGDCAASSPNPLYGYGGAPRGAHSPQSGSRLAYGFSSVDLLVQLEVNNAVSSAHDTSQGSAASQGCPDGSTIDNNRGRADTLPAATSRSTSTSSSRKFTDPLLSLRLQNFMRMSDPPECVKANLARFLAETHAETEAATEAEEVMRATYLPQLSRANAGAEFESLPQEMDPAVMTAPAVEQVEDTEQVGRAKHVEYAELPFRNGHYVGTAAPMSPASMVSSNDPTGHAHPFPPRKYGHGVSQSQGWRQAAFGYQYDNSLDKGKQRAMTDPLAARSSTFGGQGASGRGLASSLSDSNQYVAFLPSVLGHGAGLTRRPASTSAPEPAPALAHEIFSQREMADPSRRPFSPAKFVIDPMSPTFPAGGVAVPARTPTTATFNTTFGLQPIERYKGARGTLPRGGNQSNVPPDMNTCLWLEGAPRDLTYAELLGSIRNCGRVFSTHINEPQSGHVTSAAKIAFFTRAGAERLMLQSFRSEYLIRGEKVSLRWNRNAYAECDRLIESRVLLIRGPKKWVNMQTLSEFFQKLFWYNIVCIDELDIEDAAKLAGGPWLTGTGTTELPEEYREMAAMKWEFGSFHAQAQAAKQSCEREPAFCGLVKVNYLPDPCDFKG